MDKNHTVFKCTQVTQNLHVILLRVFKHAWCLPVYNNSIIYTFITHFSLISSKVCSEEILTEIQDRYIKYNMHAPSYTWKFKGKNLDMDKTLTENGVVDESEEFYRLGMNEELFLPPIHLYFNDDLTEA